jgi:hypothetical protein
MPSHSVVKVIDAKTNKLKGHQTEEEKWIAIVKDGQLSTTDYGYRLGYRAKGMNLYTESGNLAITW